MNMNQYEVMYVIDPALEDSARTELINRFSDLVKKNGGEVDRVDEWGKRRLAYAIQYKTEGYYVLMYIKAPAELPRELERNLRINESVIRYLTVKLEEKHSKVKPRAARPAPVVEAPVAEAPAEEAAAEAPAAEEAAPVAEAEAPAEETAPDAE